MTFSLHFIVNLKGMLFFGYFYAASTTPPQLTPSHRLQSLVENRTTYSHERFELNVFETHQPAEKVELQFQDFVLTSMFRGKKVMHLGQKASFDYLPGESVVFAPGEKMCIDFPEAQFDNPTQCLALEIDGSMIKQTLGLLNEEWTRPDACGTWDLDPRVQHVLNGEELTNTLNRAVHLSVSTKAEMKDALLDLAIKEILIRLLQTHARELLARYPHEQASQNPFASVVQYLGEHLHENINMDDLARHACMSRACFYAKFKEVTGQTPARFLAQMRLKKAQELLRNSPFNVSEVAAQCGFENLSHFSVAFKKTVGLSPQAFRKSAKA